MLDSRTIGGCWASSGSRQAASNSGRMRHRWGNAPERRSPASAPLPRPRGERRPQTSSSRSSRPTKAAARCRLSTVTLPFAFRMRSTCARLVCMRWASCALVMPWRSISLTSCQATMRVTASAFAASRMPSSAKKASRVVPQWGSSRSRLHILHPPPRPGPNPPPAFSEST